jgi:hypothetical protein
MLGDTTHPFNCELCRILPQQPASKQKVSPHQNISVPQEEEHTPDTFQFRRTQLALACLPAQKTTRPFTFYSWSFEHQRTSPWPPFDGLIIIVGNAVWWSRQCEFGL